MSKETEALARRIDDVLEQGGMGTKGLPEAVALLDDFARKVRERAAEHLRTSEEAFTYDADGTQEGCQVIAVDDAIAAILADEED